jgi:hypothetical protein
LDYELRDNRKFSYVLQKLAAYSGPSNAATAISIGDDFVRNKFLAVGLANPLLEIGPFAVTDVIDPGPPGFDLARELVQFRNILIRPCGHAIEQILPNGVVDKNITIDLLVTRGIGMGASIPLRMLTRSPTLGKVTQPDT